MYFSPNQTFGSLNNFESKKIYGFKYFFGSKLGGAYRFWDETNFRIQKNMVQICFGSKTFFGSKKILGQILFFGKHSNLLVFKTLRLEFDKKNQSCFSTYPVLHKS